MDKKANKTHSGIFNEVQSPRFKPWMRTIAAIVLFCFCYQDAISAMGGDYERTIKTMLQPSTIVPTIQHPTGLMVSLLPQKVYADSPYGSDSFDGGGNNNGGSQTAYTPPPTPTYTAPLPTPTYTPPPTPPPPHGGLPL